MSRKFSKFRRLPLPKQPTFHDAKAGFPPMTSEKRAQNVHTDDASSDWLKQISHAAQPRRVISMEFLRAFLTRHFERKPVGDVTQSERLSLV